MAGRPAFVINCRDKEKFVGQAVRGALSQTVPCEIILSDQGSTDGSLQAMRDTVRDFGPTHHDVKIVECPVRGAYGMAAGNAHFDWAWRQTSPDCEWIFQCSADDHSLSDRVKVCMEAVAANPCSAVATTMFFEKPGEEKRHLCSGYPTESGYVDAAVGLGELAYGSVIAGYSRKFLEKVGTGGPNTIDVLWGFLASLDDGFYVVKNEQHVHVEHASVENNMGFGGKLRAATGDESLLLNELNHLQLAILYDSCLKKAMELHPEGMPETAYRVAVNAVFSQLQAQLGARRVLNEKGLRPMVLV